MNKDTFALQRLAAGLLVALVLGWSLSGCGGRGSEGGDPPPSDAALPAPQVEDVAMGCAGFTLGAGDHFRSVMFGGMTRTYKLHVPPGYSQDSLMPLVLSFHGGLGTGEKHEDLTGFSRVADAKSFLMAYPDGFRRSWNASDDDNNPAARNNIDDVGFVSALIDHVAMDFCVDTKRVYAAGMSNGGRLSHRLGCQLSDKIAAIAPVAAPMPVLVAMDCSPSRPVSVVEFHGTEDPLASFEGGATGAGNPILSIPETMQLWVNRNGCPSVPQVTEEPVRILDGSTRVSKERYGPCDNGTEVILYAIEGGGHTWPGGQPFLVEFLVGATSQQINASEVIGDFFLEHALP